VTAFGQVNCLIT